MCRIIARDDPEAVRDNISYYIQKADGATGAKQEVAVGMARDLAVDIAPFSNDVATEALDKLAAVGTPLYNDAADAVALAMAPYNPSRVAQYVNKDKTSLVTTSNQPLGVALVQKMPTFYTDFRKRIQEPIISWADFVHNPTKTTEKYANEALDGTYFKNFAYWLAAAALKAQTESQK
jgi:hypothetical protein